MGDPTGSGKSGFSIYNQIPPFTKYFKPSVNPKLKHKSIGTVSLALTVNSENDLLAGSQFFITLSDNVDYLDGKHCIIGQVAEGLDVLAQINDAFVDSENRPLRSIRIKHTIILEDPFPDPPQLTIPSRSPSPDRSIVASLQIEEGETLDEDLTEEQRDKLVREKEAKAQALTLEMVGDLPFANVKPAENVLFVCKLNPITTDQDLELIFSRFGPIISCEIIRDAKSNDSLGYAFVEFENQADCEEAYFKMDNVLIDDRRIHVDFSQSVSKLNKFIDTKQKDGGYQLRDKFKTKMDPNYLFDHQDIKLDKRSGKNERRNEDRGYNNRSRRDDRGKDYQREERDRESYRDESSRDSRRDYKHRSDDRDYRRDRTRANHRSRSRSPTRHRSRR